MQSQTTKVTDLSLLKSSRSGDKAAFRLLVERYQTTAFRFAFRMACNTLDAQDIVQEAFIRVWNYRKNLRPEARFTTLLYTIISRLWIDQRRKTKKQGVFRALDSVADQLMDRAPSPEAIIINQDLAEQIRRLSKGLTPRQKLVFTLRDLEDLSIREVEDITGLSTGSVKTNLSLARRELRQQLQQISGKSS